MVLSNLKPRPINITSTKLSFINVADTDNINSNKPIKLKIEITAINEELI